MSFIRILLLSLIIFIQLSKANAQDIQFSMDSIQASLDTLALQREALEDSLEQIKLRKVMHDLKTYAIPYATDSNLIVHTAMILQYNEQHEQADWVVHAITPDISELRQGRTNNFRPDPLVATGTAVESDYFLTDTLADGKVTYDGFGFDRGHLAPSADFRWSRQALSESFFYSNMSPQRPEFNREIWARLEDYLRAYVIANKVTLYVTTGPVLNNDLPTIKRSSNQVSIPKLYYKLAVDVTNQEGIAFLMPNAASIYPIENYVVSIDSVEALTGFDFYHNLQTELQNKVEANMSIEPFQIGEKSENSAPIPLSELPIKDATNSVEAKFYANSGKAVNVCGQVASATTSSKGNIFLNLDQAFPNQIFSITIFKKNTSNFSYNPADYLKGRVICVKGKVSSYKGTPSMILDNEKQLTVIEGM